MKPALLQVLVIVNLALVVYVLVQQRRHPSSSETGAATLRVRALELVDDAGRVRAELKVFPAEPNLKMPDGTVGYPETVLFRLISSQGAPFAKFSASEDGGGMVLGGDSSYAQILSRGTNAFIKLVNKDGREQLFKP